MTPRIKTATHSPVKKIIFLKQISQVNTIDTLISTIFFLSIEQPQNVSMLTAKLTSSHDCRVESNVSPSRNSFRLACVFPNTLYLILHGLNLRIRLFS